MPANSPAPSTLADIAIVGGGPTGLFAAFYAGLRQMSVILIDSLDLLGGQLTTLYPEKYIYDVAGFPRILAKDLARQLIKQGLQYKPTVALGEQIKTLDADGQSFRLVSDKAQHHARTILVAAGIGAFVPKRLPVPESLQYESRGVFYTVKSIEAFRGQRILIVGGGDSAIDWANALSGVSASQTLIHRRDGFRAHEDSLAQMMAGPTLVRTFHELRHIEGDGKVERALIYDNRTNDQLWLDIDAILVNVGFESSLGPIKHWGLDLQGASIKVDSTMKTSRPGIFAAGDICTYPGKLKLIATGFGEAATAVNHAKNFLDPHAKVFPGHSSEMSR